MNKCVTCRLTDGGAPKCSIGMLAGQYAGPKSVEIKGHSLHCILKSRYMGQAYCRADCYQRKYDVMIIGEAPTADDDAMNFPFSGAVGDILMGFLEKANYDPDKTFLTQVVRCRPPKGRKPSASEIKTCTNAYLLNEIKTLEPKVIIALGATVLRSFALHNKGGVGGVRGKVHTDSYFKDDNGEFHGPFNVVGSFNPAAFLHKPNPQLQARVVADYHIALQAVKGNIKQNADYYQAKFKLVRTPEDIEWLREKLMSVPAFAFDTESPGTPWTKHPMMTLSVSWGHTTDPNDPKTAVVPIYEHDPVKKQDEENHKYVLKGSWYNADPSSSEAFSSLVEAFEASSAKEILQRLKDPFEDPNIAKIAHNIKYDINVLRAYAGFRIKGKLWDTMLMHHLLDETTEQGLEPLSDMEFGVGDYKKPVRDITGHGRELHHGYDHVPNEILWPYTATDSELTYRLWEKFLPRLQAKKNLMMVYEVETEPALRSLAKAEWNGNYMFKDKLEQIKVEYEEELNELLVKLKAMTNPSFNPNSTPQVRDALKLQGYTVEIADRLKASGYNTSKERLADLRSKSSIADGILEFRNKQKMISTYIQNMIDDLDYDGRLRYGWLLHGTETGRLSCRLLQQVPRLDEKRKAAGKLNMRELFGVPPGYKYVYMDFSQVELRILAIIAKDKELRRLFAEGKNIHSETAATVLEIPVDQVSKVNRQLGKSINFGIAYGSEGYQISKKNEWEDRHGNKHPVTLDMVQEFMKKFKKRFVGVADYIETLPDMVRFNGGTLVTITGRERHFGAVLNDKDQSKRNHAERAAINCSIQGPAGAIALRTITLIDEQLDSYIDSNQLLETDVCMVNTVHDSIAYQVRDEYVDWFTPFMKAVAERPIPELENESFPIDYGVGMSWAEAEENSK